MERKATLQKLEQALLTLSRPVREQLGIRKEFQKNKESLARRECEEALRALVHIEEKAFLALRSHIQEERWPDALVMVKELSAASLAAQAQTTPLPDSLRLPTEIARDIQADMHEMQLCLQAHCYRSAIILCGRVLETALHRKYFELTGNDLLETSPGVGIGKIIAKLKEENVSLPVGLTEQIHLINHVRISSVHKKSELFLPTQGQTQAIVLFTTDALQSLFK